MLSSGAGSMSPDAELGGSHGEPCDREEDGLCDAVADQPLVAHGGSAGAVGDDRGQRDAIRRGTERLLSSHRQSQGSDAVRVDAWLAAKEGHGAGDVIVAVPTGRVRLSSALAVSSRIEGEHGVPSAVEHVQVVDGVGAGVVGAVHQDDGTSVAPRHIPPARRTPSRAGKVTSRAPGYQVAALAMSGWGADVTMPAVPTGRMTHWT